MERVRTGVPTAKLPTETATFDRHGGGSTGDPSVRATAMLAALPTVYPHRIGETMVRNLVSFTLAASNMLTFPFWIAQALMHFLDQA